MYWEHSIRRPCAYSMHSSCLTTFFSQFAHEKTDLERDWVICLKAPSQWITKPGLEPNLVPTSFCLPMRHCWDVNAIQGVRNLCSLLYPHHPAVDLVLSMYSVNIWWGLTSRTADVEKIGNLKPHISLPLFIPNTRLGILHIFPPTVPELILISPYDFSFVCSLPPEFLSSHRNIPCSHAQHHAFYNPFSHSLTTSLAPDWCLIRSSISPPMRWEAGLLD